eukprot:8904726-Pyramimonas_sp.AAC.2
MKTWLHAGAYVSFTKIAKAGRRKHLLTGFQISILTEYPTEVGQLRNPERAKYLSWQLAIRRPKSPIWPSGDHHKG